MKEVIANLIPQRMNIPKHMRLLTLLMGIVIMIVIVVGLVKEGWPL
jgi:hypothetical protein